MATKLRRSWSKLVVMVCISVLMKYGVRISSAAQVSHLPSFEGALPFHLETGYVTVEKGSEYFYYFVESERNPSEDPLILWLIGGPYCAGFTGLVWSIGPLRFETDAYNDTSLTLVYNPHSWTKISSVIFLDWPVGAGFSFSQNAEKYTSDDINSSKEIYEFLKQWLLHYPRFLSNPAYVGGDSYGGKLVPLVAKEIVEGNDELGQLDQPALVINLKGYLVGNGVTAVRADLNSQVPRAHGLGIISDELFELLVKSCEGDDYMQPLKADCAANMNIYNQFISEINIQNVLAPNCDGSMMAKRRRSMMEDKINREIMLDPPKSGHDPCNKDLPHLTNLWGNNPLVWKALHIKEGTLENWQFCKEDLNKKYIFSVESVVPYHFYLATKGYRALIYSGDHDLKVPFTRTMEWIRSLNFSVIQGWRSWHFDGQVAGYTVLFSNNLTFATVLGGSHTPPTNKPIQSFSMFERWMSNEHL